MNLYTESPKTGRAIHSGISSSSHGPNFSTASVHLTNHFYCNSYIINLMTVTANVSIKSPEDDLDRILDDMTDDERMKLAMSLTGSRPDYEEDTDEDWGFIDWATPDDDLPV